MRCTSLKNLTFLIFIIFLCTYILVTQYYHGIKNEQNTEQSLTEEAQFTRQTRLRKFCNNRSVELKVKRKYSEDLIYSDREHVMYCSVAKVACTSWKRVILYLEGDKRALEMQGQKVHRQRYNYLHEMRERADANWRLNTYYSFLFVRHPFARLLSAYRNKFLDPIPGSDWFQRSIGKLILKKYRNDMPVLQQDEGKGVTFEEFVRYIIDTYERYGYGDYDNHWQLINNICTPCNVKYNYIGKVSVRTKNNGSVGR